MARIRAGFCVYPNPLFPRQYHRVSLCPQDVLGIVFWTRQPTPLFRHLGALDRAGYVYYFQQTIVGYPEAIDRRAPSREEGVRSFAALSERIGAERVVWRYDPILLSRTISGAWHRDNFRRMADALAGRTRRVVVSVLDPYVRTRRRLETAEDGIEYRPAAYEELLQTLASEARARGMAMQSCAEPALRVAGIEPGRCVDGALLRALAGGAGVSRWRRHRQREGCLCHASVDIGVNDSCGFGCRYCYATRGDEIVPETLRQHRPEWTSLSADVGAVPHNSRLG
jgi:hypothetical protein